MVAKTNAERQRDFRANRQHLGEGGNGEHNVNVWLSTKARLALMRISSYYFKEDDQNKRSLEKLIEAEDLRILKSLISDDDIKKYQAPTHEDLKPLTKNKRLKDKSY